MRKFPQWNKWQLRFQDTTCTVNEKMVYFYTKKTEELKVSPGFFNLHNLKISLPLFNEQRQLEFVTKRVALPLTNETLEVKETYDHA